MKRALLVLLAVMLTAGVSMARQQVAGGGFGDTPALVVRGSVVSDKDACGRPYDVLVVADRLPEVGSMTPLNFRVWNLPWGQHWAYIFTNDQLVAWRQVANGDILTVQTAGPWLAGNYRFDVVISTGVRWPIPTCVAPLPLSSIGAYVAPNCSEGIEVESIMIDIRAPACPPPPCQPTCQQPCCQQPACGNCCNPLLFFLGLLIGACH